MRNLILATILGALTWAAWETRPVEMSGNLAAALTEQHASAPFGPSASNIISTGSIVSGHAVQWSAGDPVCWLSSNLVAASTSSACTVSSSSGTTGTTGTTGTQTWARPSMVDAAPSAFFARVPKVGK